jgi:hypothetical protein
MGKSAKDEIPQVVLDAINVFDDAMNDTQADIVYMDDYWHVRAENDELLLLRRRSRLPSGLREKAGNEGTQGGVHSCRSHGVHRRRGVF